MKRTSNAKTQSSQSFIDGLFSVFTGGTATGFISLGSAANGGLGNMTGFTIVANASVTFGKLPYSVGIALGGAKLQSQKPFHPAGNKPTPQSVEDFISYVNTNEPNKLIASYVAKYARQNQQAWDKYNYAWNNRGYAE